MVLVYNEETGQTREMGEAQFARVKKNGWAIKPASKSNKPNTETGSDSGNANKGTGNPKAEDDIDVILKDNAKGVVALIKDLAEAGSYDTIKAIGERESASKDPRSTVATAVEKFGTPKED